MLVPCYSNLGACDPGAYGPIEAAGNGGLGQMGHLGQVGQLSLIRFQKQKVEKNYELVCLIS